jgi:phosphoribosyl 1,2-cyclic phosphodiesterase
MQINLCGTRGSTPAPGRDFVRYGGHTSCVAITPDDGTVPELLLDAGTGIRQVPGLLAGRAFAGTIALTHLHWDHTQGLPFFVGGDRADARVRVLIPAAPGSGAAVAGLERMMSPPNFPITPRQLRGNWTFDGLEPGLIGVGPLTLMAREIPHKGGRTFGYRVSDGRTAICYLPDHDPAGLGPGPDGLGVYHDAALELADGADIVMHDSVWYAEEFDPAATFGHAAAEYAIGLGEAAGARRVLLLHHRPDRTDAELDKKATVMQAEGSGIRVDLGADGDAISL